MARTKQTTRKSTCARSPSSPSSGEETLTPIKRFFHKQEAAARAKGLIVKLDDEPGGMRREDRKRIAGMHSVRMQEVRGLFLSAEAQRKRAEQRYQCRLKAEEEIVDRYVKAFGKPLEEKLSQEQRAMFQRVADRKRRRHEAAGRLEAAVAAR